jgi:hypothetical protein
MKSFKTWTDYHHRINLVFHAIVAFTLLPFTWIFLQIDSATREKLTQDWFIMFLLALPSLSLAFTADVVGKKLVGEAVAKPTLREKLDAYFRAQVVMYAMLETGAIFATIAFYITTHYLFVVVYVLLLFVFSLKRPTLDKVSRELLLPKAEREVLANREEIAG